MRILSWFHNALVRRRLDRQLKSGLRKSLAELRLEQAHGRELIAESRRRWPVE